MFLCIETTKVSDYFESKNYICGRNVKEKREYEAGKTRLKIGKLRDGRITLEQNLGPQGCRPYACYDVNTVVHEIVKGSMCCM